MIQVKFTLTISRNGLCGVQSFAFLTNSAPAPAPKKYYSPTLSPLVSNKNITFAALFVDLGPLEAILDHLSNRK